MVIPAIYRFNILQDGEKWLKSRVVELILNSKPEIIQQLLPEFQVFGLDSARGMRDTIITFTGKRPTRLLVSASDMMRHIQGVERGTLGFGYEIPLSFAKLLSEIEISLLDDLYPISGHPTFDFIGIKVTPEESYYSTMDFKTCSQYVTRPVWRIGEDAEAFTKRRYELGMQYKNAIERLLRDEEKRLGIKIALMEKAVIELKSSARKIIALSSKQKGLLPKLIDNGFNFYVLLAHFKPDWNVEFTLQKMERSGSAHAWFKILFMILV